MENETKIRRQVRNKTGYLIGYTVETRPVGIETQGTIIFEQPRNKEGYLLPRRPIQKIIR